MRAGGTSVEGTAGNTGIGLSLVANDMGFKTVILIPETQSQEKKDALMLYGATRAYANDAEVAVETAKQALAKAQRVFGADSINGIETATYLGQLCSNVRRYRDSAEIPDEAMAR